VKKESVSHLKMFFIDNSTERSMQDAQSLYERAASRSLNQSMTLLADEIQQVPTRMPINDREQQKDVSIPNSNTFNALANSSSDSTKFKNQAREETDTKHKNPRSTKSSAKISVATSPLKATTSSDHNALLSTVSGK
jgi:hypothetical protein